MGRDMCPHCYGTHGIISHCHLQLEFEWANRCGWLVCTECQTVYKPPNAADSRIRKFRALDVVVDEALSILKEIEESQ